MGILKGSSFVWVKSLLGEKKSPSVVVLSTRMGST